MNTRNPFKIAALASVAALALYAGCKKQEIQDDGHGHAGRKHSEGSEATGARDGAGAVKCAAHGAPKELCFICDPSLREKGRLWCEEHKRYEDRCFECHPELRDKNRLWCNEHSLTRMNVASVIRK